MSSRDGMVAIGKVNKFVRRMHAEPVAMYALSSHYGGTMRITPASIRIESDDIAGPYSEFGRENLELFKSGRFVYNDCTPMGARVSGPIPHANVVFTPSPDSVRRILGSIVVGIEGIPGVSHEKNFSLMFLIEMWRRFQGGHVTMTRMTEEEVLSFVCYTEARDYIQSLRRDPELKKDFEETTAKKLKRFEEFRNESDHCDCND